MANMIDPVLSTENAINRPTTTSVVSMLNSSTNATLPLPLEPVLYAASPYILAIEESDLRSSASVNEMSVSEFYPR
ncbi:hypothetical protein ACS0TY_035205 [Phlomoides rotata]